MHSLYYFLRLAIVWMCCFWHLPIFSFLWGDFLCPWLGWVWFLQHIYFHGFSFHYLCDEVSCFIRRVSGQFHVDSFSSLVYLPEGNFYPFFRLFIVWVVRSNLIFSPTFLRIYSLLALKILISSWRSSVQNYRSHTPERFCMWYCFLVDPCWIDFFRRKTPFCLNSYSASYFKSSSCPSRAIFIPRLQFLPL